MPLKSGKLTPQERVFTEVYVRTGDAAYSAEKAGYRHPERQGANILAKQAINEEVHRQTMARVHNTLLPLAVDRLEGILRDTKETSRNVLTAVKLVKDWTSDYDDAQARKEPHEMALDEISSEIDRLKRIQAERQAITIDGDVVKDSVFG